MDSNVGTANRVEGLDLLRGICALAVAYYHPLVWIDHVRLHNWGRYAVYIFFVLSGASMYIAYRKRFESGYPMEKFIALRFARLAPLYLLAVLANILFAVLVHRPLLPELSQGVLNVTFLFGLGNPGATSQVTGGWSLGIEFLFYLMFPVLLALVRSRASLWILALSFIGQHIFIASTLNGTTLQDAWIPYTQFLSFVFYFVAGCFIGKWLENGLLKSSNLWVCAFLVALIPLALINVEKNLTGALGIAFSLCAVAAVAASAGLPIGRLISPVAQVFGKMSYGLYLIHPLVYIALKNIAPSLKASPLAFSTVVVAVSIPIALTLEHYYELPIRQWIASKLSKRAAQPQQALSPTESEGRITG